MLVHGVEVGDTKSHASLEPRRPEKTLVVTHQSESASPTLQHRLQRREPTKSRSRRGAARPFESRICLEDVSQSIGRDEVS